jgi:hypothetical protein
MEMSLREYSRHRGCSLAAVQKAISSGRISVCRSETKGAKSYSWVDSAESDRRWQENTDPTQQRVATRAEMGKGPQISRREPTPEPDVPVGGKSKNETGEYGQMYNKGRAIREGYSARLARLEYEKRSGMLIETEKVKVAFFNAANKASQSLLGLSTRIGSRISGEYKISVDSVIEKFKAGPVTQGELREVLVCVADLKSVQDIIDLEVRIALQHLADGKFSID